MIIIYGDSVNGQGAVGEIQSLQFSELKMYKG